MGRIAHLGRGRPAPRAAALAAAGVLAVGTLTGCGSSLASAATTLAGVSDAQVVHADGTVVPATDGLRLHRGDIVRTGPAGRAELHTRGRIVYEASQAVLAVANGGRADLRQGAVVVDAQHGAGLALTVTGLTVTVPHGSATRAESSFTVRIGALAGAATVTSGTGRHLDVAPLTQALVGGDALPDSTSGSPLRLTDDDGEAHAVPGLVRDDLDLNALAAGIDSSGPRTVRTVTAAWHSGVQSLPAGVRSSEQILPIVIAATDPSTAPSRYADAVRLRQAGGSWGVVAHLLGTTAAQVISVLDAFEKGAGVGRTGLVPPALLPGVVALVGGPPPTPGSGPAPAPRPTTSGHHPSPRPSPSPSPSSSPGLIGNAIDLVLHLLPTPVPTPTSLLPALPSVSLPSVHLAPLRVPSVTVGGGGAAPAPVPTPSAPR